MIFENHSVSSPILSSKTNMRYFEEYAKRKCVWFNKIRIRKKETHRSDINTTRPRHGLNLKCASIWWWLCVTSNTLATLGAEFIKKWSNTETELIKACISSAWNMINLKFMSSIVKHGGLNVPFYKTFTNRC